MDKLLFVLVFALLIFGCRETKKDNQVNHDALAAGGDTITMTVATAKKTKKRADSEIIITWTDSLIEEYVHRSNNKLIKLALKNKTSETWLFDQIINSDTATYLTFQIGHHITDKRGTNPRFITDQWIYIDSLTKQVYEYDLANDNLIR